MQRSAIVLDESKGFVVQARLLPLVLQRRVQTSISCVLELRNIFRTVTSRIKLWTR